MEKKEIEMIGKMLHRTAMAAGLATLLLAGSATTDRVDAPAGAEVVEVEETTDSAMTSGSAVTDSEVAVTTGDTTLGTTTTRIETVIVPAEDPSMLSSSTTVDDQEDTTPAATTTTTRTRMRKD